MTTEITLPVITRAKLVLTEQCQLRCKYCYENHGTESMSLETAKIAIDTIIKNAEAVGKIPHISFFGGEPLLVYEELLKPCIEYIRNDLKSRCSLAFTTNGLLLDEEKLQYLRSMNVNFMLSIDGCQEAHNANRIYKNGKGSFSKVEANIPLILKYFPSTRARMTVTPSNVMYLYDSVKYIASEGFIDFHVIPDLHILNDRDWEPNDFVILDEQLKLIESYIIDSFEEYNVPLVFKTLEDMFPRIVLAMHCKESNHYRTADCCNPKYRCGIGMLDNVIVDINGDIYSCQHAGTSKDSIFYLGDVNEGINNEARLNILEMSKEPLRSVRMDCKECPLDYVCTGGCTPNNYSLNEDLTLIPESYCRWMQSLYSSALRIIEHFDSKQDNLLFKDYFYGVVKRGVACVC